MDVRQRTEEIERLTFAPWATFSDASRGRARPEPQDPIRPVFQRDRDRVIHCKAFRRLKQKTQVFLSPEGDLYRTRLTHTLEVAQVARTLARCLRLNEDLTEAIALGHDLGHTPFGHIGENTLNHRVLGGFRHNEQSLRVVETIENGGRGLNLMPEVRDGILCHTGPVRAETLEGRIVAVADRIAYVNHDIDDAIRAGVLCEGDLPPSTHEVLGCDHSSRIETLVVDVVRTSAAEDDIRLSPRVWDAMAELREFLFDNVYTCDAVMEEVAKAMRLIDVLFSYYIENPGEIPVEYRAISEGDDVRAATDYIAGMTDRYAKSRFQNLFEPHSLHV